MASINQAAGQISAKVVYCGPGASGKTANLQVIHRASPPGRRRDMLPLAADAECTRFYDCLDLHIGKIKGFDMSLQIYSMPGFDEDAYLRRLLMQGVDGVVFVADSAADKFDANIFSFQELEGNLAVYGYTRETVPIYIQYNKRDLPDAVDVRLLNERINTQGLPYGDGIANRGIGVFEALKLIGREITDRLSRGAMVGAA